MQLRFLRGQYPEQVDIHVQRYHRSELVKHKDDMGSWYGQSFFDESWRWKMCSLMPRDVNRLKQKFQEKETLLQGYYQHGEFVGKKPACEQTPIKAMVYEGIAFNLFVVAVASYLIMAFPWYTCAWMAVCAAFSIQKARSFGQGDKRA